MAIHDYLHELFKQMVLVKEDGIEYCTLVQAGIQQDVTRDIYVPKKFAEELVTQYRRVDPMSEFFLCDLAQNKVPRDIQLTIIEMQGFKLNLEKLVTSYMQEALSTASRQSEEAVKSTAADSPEGESKEPEQKAELATESGGPEQEGEKTAEGGEQGKEEVARDSSQLVREDAPVEFPKTSVEQSPEMGGSAEQVVGTQTQSPETSDDTGDSEPQDIDAQTSKENSGPEEPANDAPQGSPEGSPEDAPEVSYNPEDDFGDLPDNDEIPGGSTMSADGQGRTEDSGEVTDDTGATCEQKTKETREPISKQKESPEAAEDKPVAEQSKLDQLVGLHVNPQTPLEKAECILIKFQKYFGVENPTVPDNGVVSVALKIADGVESVLFDLASTRVSFVGEDGIISTSEYGTIDKMLSECLAHLSTELLVNLYNTPVEYTADKSDDEMDFAPSIGDVPATQPEANEFIPSDSYSGVEEKAEINIIPETDSIKDSDEVDDAGKPAGEAEGEHRKEGNTPTREAEGEQSDPGSIGGTGNTTVAGDTEDEVEYKPKDKVEGGTGAESENIQTSKDMLQGCHPADDAESAKEPSTLVGTSEQSDNEKQEELKKLTDREIALQAIEYFSGREPDRNSSNFSIYSFTDINGKSINVIVNMDEFTVAYFDGCSEVCKTTFGSMSDMNVRFLCDMTPNSIESYYMSEPIIKSTKEIVQPMTDELNELQSIFTSISEKDRSAQLQVSQRSMDEVMSLAEDILGIYIPEATVNISAENRKYIVDDLATVLKVRDAAPPSMIIEATKYLVEEIAEALEEAGDTFSEEVQRKQAEGIEKISAFVSSIAI